MKGNKSYLGFDLLSCVYDILTRLVFGNAMREAQVKYLGIIPKQGRVLVLGGGTGWILDEIFKAQPDCNITYIEASKGMLNRSRKESAYGSRVAFVQGTEQNIPCNEYYDVVVTNFFLDLFAKKNLVEVMKNIDKSLMPNGKWVVTDFVEKGVFWQSVLIWVMYRFFRLCCRIEANQLLNFSYYFQQIGYKRVSSAHFYWGMIDGSVWEHNN